MAETNRIKKIKLSDGKVYSIFDAGALRLNDQKILLTGDAVVDKIIIDGKLHIVEVDDVPVESSINNVLIQDTTTGEIKKRSTDYLLEDIGGISYSMDATNGVLSFKFGRQTE